MISVFNSYVKWKFKAPALSTEQLQTWIDQSKAFVLLDSREKAEYDVSKIPGARHLPFNADIEPFLTELSQDGQVKGTYFASLLLSRQFNSIPDIVCYCSIGYRSSILANRINEALNSRQQPSETRVTAFNLEGSIFKWANEGRTLSSEKQVRKTLNQLLPTRSLLSLLPKEQNYKLGVHPYNRIFGQLLNRDLWKWSK